MARNRSENWRWRAYQEGQQPDARDLQPNLRKPVCGPGQRAAWGHQDDWDHPDAKEVVHQSNLMRVTLCCPHCGHEWREPR